MSKCVNSISGTEGMAGIETVMTNPKASDMTLRDHFAITYMQSCVAGNAYFETFEGVSEEAYKMADAMIQARSK